jgi:putative ABC transport system substrate-binding protein
MAPQWASQRTKICKVDLIIKEMPMRPSSLTRLIPLALGLLAMLPAADAQPAEKVSKLGILASASGHPGLRETFRQGLQALGYVEGQNLHVESRQAEGRMERLPALAAELVQLEADVIVAMGSSAVRAAQQATQAIPIVMLISGDPIGAGLVTSLARPGGNVTGMTSLSSRLSVRRLALLKELLPQLIHLAVLFNPGDEAKMVDWHQLQAASRGWGVRLHPAHVRSPHDLASAFTAMRRQDLRSLLVLNDSVTFQARSELVRLAAEHRLPTMYEYREFVELGGLMAYGPHLPAMVQRLASYVDQLLKGATPGELPIEAPTTFEFVLNIRAAEALGLAIPPSILAQATEVIR